MMRVGSRQRQDRKSNAGLRRKLFHDSMAQITDGHLIVVLSPGRENYRYWVDSCINDGVYSVRLYPVYPVLTARLHVG